MQIYSLNDDGAASLRWQGGVRILAMFPLFLAFWLVMLGLANEPTELGVKKTLIAALLLGAGASVAKWFTWVDEIRKYKLLVDADAICMVGRGSANTVLRGQVKTTWEKKDGLYLSGRAGLFARMGGYVWIPKEMPEYAALKDLATSWKMSSRD